MSTVWRRFSHGMGVLFCHRELRDRGIGYGFPGSVKIQAKIAALVSKRREKAGPNPPVGRFETTPWQNCQIVRSNPKSGPRCLHHLVLVTPRSGEDHSPLTYSPLTSFSLPRKDPRQRN